MRLCALLGVSGRRVLRSVLSREEYLDWLALYNCDPWGEDRADLRARTVAIATVAPWAKRGWHPSPTAFMPYVKPQPRRRMSEAELKKMIVPLAEKWNKRVAELDRKKARRCRKTS